MRVSDNGQISCIDYTIGYAIGSTDITEDKSTSFILIGSQKILVGAASASSSVWNIPSRVYPKKDDMG